MAEKMIEVKNVSMKFRMSDEPINSLKEIFTTALTGKLKYNEFLALDDVSFDLEKGKTLGLIGKNGAGKSTTLKLISGILKPTSGNIIVRGNVVPMLELGAGFDLELTGRENIYLNGAILGYSKDYLQSKFNEIVEFAEIGEFNCFRRTAGDTDRGRDPGSRRRSLPGEELQPHEGTDERRSHGPVRFS